MPLFHTMGLRTLLCSIVVGGTWVALPAFDAGEAVDLVAREDVTSLYLVPTMFWSLLRTGGLERARGLRTLAYAGAAMTPSLAEELAGTVAPESFVNHFGSTEVYTFTVHPDARSVRDGWYRSGDLAVADDDGDLWVSGRTDDMINSGGENVYPDEIEVTLARCPGIDDVCVVGLPDERWGQAVTAFVVPVPGVDPHAAATRAWEFCREALPSLKRPKRVIAVDEVPRSGVGKTLRRVLVAGEHTARGGAS